ncbi:MAG: hypothetical protein K2H76_08665 [Muribaculaceae bacterium]|nr:hypothetical protein [Muribaculaceae bacterium]
MTHQEEAIADSLAVLQADEQTMALADEKKKAKSHTWIYVIILVILVVLVVWLMIYAANMMKKQGKEVRDVEGLDKKAKKEIAALEAENEKLRSEIGRLKAANESAKAETIRLRAAIAKADEKAQKAEQTAAQAARTLQESPVAAAAPTQRKKEEPKPQPKVLNEIYLGRANQKGLFVRGDRRPNPGHTIYRLDTKDGIVGTFRFANTPEAFELAVSNPIQFLAGGCVSENFEDAETASKIVTETPGTAILENGCWKVLRKSRIRFE